MTPESPRFDVVGAHGPWPAARSAAGSVAIVDLPSPDRRLTRALPLADNPPANSVIEARWGMSVGDHLRKNLHFWHWYPRLLCEDLTEEQLHWQPESNPNHIIFALWHAYRSEDEIIHGLLAQRQSVFARDNWAPRLPVEEPGNPPYGTGLERDQIARIRLGLDEILAYAEAVGGAMQEYADSLSEADGAEMVPLPFFQPVYPMLDAVSRAEVLTFFCVGHTAEHLGEVQYIKGLLGKTGAPF